MSDLLKEDAPYIERNNIDSIVIGKRLDIIRRVTDCGVWLNGSPATVTGVILTKAKVTDGKERLYVDWEYLEEAIGTGRLHFFNPVKVGSRIMIF
jgi:hypothetical protein